MANESFTCHMTSTQRLIDANALKNHINGVSTHWLNDWSTIGVLAAVDKQPTVDAVEVVHGEWCEDYETFVDDSGQESYPIQTGYVCSECGVDGSPIWRYCPHCGAKMDGEGREGE